MVWAWVRWSRGKFKELKLCSAVDAVRKWSRLYAGMTWKTLSKFWEAFLLQAPLLSWSRAGRSHTETCKERPNPAMEQTVPEPLRSQHHLPHGAQRGWHLGLHLHYHNARFLDCHLPVRPSIPLQKEPQPSTDFESLLRNCQHCQVLGKSFLLLWWREMSKSNPTVGYGGQSSQAERKLSIKCVIHCLSPWTMVTQCQEGAKSCTAREQNK